MTYEPERKRTLALFRKGEAMRAKGWLSILLSVVLVVAAMTVHAEGLRTRRKKSPISSHSTPGANPILNPAMQQYFEKALGVRFVPDYKPAAGGALAWQTLANAKPDGIPLQGSTLRM